MLGVCNGFQILVEAGLLPGALIRNRGLKFICRELRLSVGTTNSPFTSAAQKGQVLRLPIAHGEGCYIADERTLDELEAEDRVAFRYIDNANGSLRNIAGVLNRERNVMGMMPHPERATEPLMGVHRRPGGLPIHAATRCVGGDRMSAAFSPEIIAQHQLTPGEYQKVVDILGRQPTYTELGIFAVMWSEHCSYKSSRVHLKKLPTRGKLVVQGPGENAGIIDIGGGYVIAFKIESHNHPSFIEPLQGAATGVGGILRDIFTMGARPIAVMDSLRFGRLDDPADRARATAASSAAWWRASRTTATASACPPWAARCIFEPCYDGNPLVNVFALGVCRKEDVFYAKAAGVGNPVIYVGARTGRDGIHGASMASAEFTEESKQKRPNVQVGDPFMEKLLLEACIEAMKTGAIVGIQDMGAAGLTCSTCEMGSRGEVGIEIELDRVPQRETGMTPYEIMLSESQERMLLVADKGREDEVFRVFKKWGLEAAEIGIVTDDGKLRVRHHGEIVAEIPNRELADEAPLYNRPYTAPPRSARAQHALSAEASVQDRPARPARRARHLLQALDLGAVRFPGAHQHADHSRADRRRHRARQGDRHVDRDVAGRQRPLHLPLAARGRATRRRRVLPQSLGDGRAARGRHQLPQLRQSRAPGDHGPTGGSHRRHVRCLPSSSTRRSPAAMSACTTRPSAKASIPRP